MSSQVRLLRRAYTGKLSLKTTDHCRTSSLLAKLSPNAIRVGPNGTKLVNGLFLCELENVLSPLECTEIIKNGDECIFQDMSEKYRFGKQRNSSRLLTIDQALAGDLWQNIEPVLSKEMEELGISKQPLGFDVTRGEWELHGLNEAMRISKYSGKKKEYFGPHIDAQYCPSGDERSLFTLVVYLNEDFCGGETCFYFPKDITQSTKDMTTQEEIDSRGGLEKGFSRVKIVPKVGHAFLFSHSILHESLPILRGTKYILKTDVVVKRHSKQFGFAVEDGEKEDYLTCLNYFREAQQKELKGNYNEASDLYERALSIRYCYPKSLQMAASDLVKNNEEQSKCRFLPFDVWQRIFEYLPGHDAQNLVYAYPSLNVAKESWEQHERNDASNLLSQKFLPKVNYHKGILTRFEFPDADFFRENSSGCCRVAAMYSFFLLGHKPEDDVYNVRYNPDTQDVCAVALETLLTDVFYNRRCYGSFYSVRQLDPKMKDPVKDFEGSVDRNYMLLRHGAEFVGVELPDSFGVKSTAYAEPDEVIGEESDTDEEEEEDEEGNEEEDEEDEKEDEDEGESKIERNVACEENDEDKKIKEICDGTVPFSYDSCLYDNPSDVDSIVRKYIHIQDRNRDSPFDLIPVDRCHSDEGIFYDIIDQDDSSGFVVYFDALANILSSKNKVSCALVSKLKKPLSCESCTVCLCHFCGDDESIDYIADSCATESYNHLIFDFQTAQLSVTRCNSEKCERDCGMLRPLQIESLSEEQDSIGCYGEAMFYEVNIEPLLSSETSFNHAACQCGHPRFEVHEYCDIKDYPYLDHIHLVAREMDGKMLVWTVYGGIVAL